MEDGIVIDPFSDPERSKNSLTGTGTIRLTGTTRLTGTIRQDEFGDEDNVRRGTKPEESDSESDASVDSKEEEGAGEESTAVSKDYSQVLCAAERDIWSFSNPVWRRFDVEKPRLPIAEDERSSWSHSKSPPSLTLFKQDMNSTSFEHLEKYVANPNLLPRCLLLTGPHSSGKSTVVKALVNDLFGRVAVPETRDGSVNNVANTDLVDSLTLRVTTQDGSSFKKLEGILKSFLERSKKIQRKSGDTPHLPPLILVDNVDGMSLQGQLCLSTALDRFTHLKMVLCAVSVNKMSSQLLAKCHTLPMKVIHQDDAVRVVLELCTAEQIGCELPALKLLFSIRWPSLKHIINDLQGTFLRYHYISAANVVKYYHTVAYPEEDKTNTYQGSSRPRGRAHKHHGPETGTRHQKQIAQTAENATKKIFSAETALGPVLRCKICTLPPPCAHQTARKLGEEGAKRRAELPQRGGYGGGSLACKSFLRFGFCPVYNKRGACSLDHPLGYHIVEDPPPLRCSQCTLPIRCGHCAYDIAKTALENCVTAALKDLEDCKLTILRAEMPASNYEKSAAAKIKVIDTYTATRVAKALYPTKPQIAFAYGEMESHRLKVEAVRTWVESTQTIDEKEYLVKIKDVGIYVQRTKDCVETALQKKDETKDRKKVNPSTESRTADSSTT